MYCLEEGNVEQCTKNSLRIQNHTAFPGFLGGGGGSTFYLTVVLLPQIRKIGLWSNTLLLCILL